ncbi:Adenosylmethionine-8-amino-7-oxononanoate aminotransferase [Candidatus Arsenophonus lipoptenae]|uniref:Adenosylmethionine-8-amino-7-oxononanoate aminotransferase n=1 Tax=Candidatus Arsenophonus lipoptenae TaxID=634113 RepID=A0A0X9VE28_9GAMM|nr:adenosylmethionine--8-amino-7-oxononanoate transaminase [Candidatus Arsenophonus lipoptenae]AMA64854.1 Adenosylmethionine-8-amino-7-oxononanoate aminotransferase [Candidatus Arsenophonus lipoptenae]
MKLYDINFDSKHIWHPYTSMTSPMPIYPIVGASGVELELADGRKLIDGMSSWWSAIHGYNHPILNQAAIQQLMKMSHVMFGGITHPAAINLCRKLIDITDNKLECIFLADSGSVAVEVALKMALQYWQSLGKKKCHFVALEGGYHGDTFGAMSVCDPNNSMHSLYEGYFSKNFFIQAPKYSFYEKWYPDDLISLKKILNKYADKIAAIIIEPIVQGAGGMRIYNSNYLASVRKLCNDYHILLIADEIATGFGRTGKLFACEHSKITPDILCLGKALTGGYLTLSVTITNRHIADTISKGKAGCFMHGPTFMGNPLSCAIAAASITLLMNSPWEKLVKDIEIQLMTELFPLKDQPQVADVRVLGAIGVVEMKMPVNVPELQRYFVAKGVWIRPFGKLIYLMPPYIITNKQLSKLTQAIRDIVIKQNNK